MKKLHSYYYFLGLAMLAFSACRNPLDKPAWDTDLLLPIAKSDLGITDMVKDSTVRVNSDNSLSVVYSEELAGIQLDSMVALEVLPFEKNVKVQSLALGNQTFSQTTTLGQIAAGLDAATRDFIYAAHGSVSIIPPVSGISFGPTDIDITSFLQSADLSGGTAYVKITNNLPLTISNVDFGVKNKLDSDFLIQDNFPTIAPGTSLSQSADLSGKHVEGQMEAFVPTMDISGGFTTIDTSASLTIEISFQDIEVSQATAVFPAQTVVDNTDYVPLQGLGDIQLTEAKIASGYVDITVVSTLEDSLYLNYKVPDASINGFPFDENVVIPPAPSGQTGRFVKQYPLKDYLFRFSGNAFSNTVVGRIDSTGQVRTLSTSDSLLIKLQIVDLTPSYVRGYLGSDTMKLGPEIVKLDIFDNVESGSVLFDSSRVSLRMENEFGMPGIVEVKSLSVSNSKTTETKSLDLSGVTNPMSIGSALAGPTFDGPGRPLSSGITLNDANSNITELLNVNPDYISFNLEAITNPAGFTGSLDNFAHIDSKIKAFLDLEIPLDIEANQLVLKDTVDFTLNATTDFTDVGKGTLIFKVENGFPLGVDIEAYFVDRFGQVIDSLPFNKPFEAAQFIDAVNTEPSKQKFEYEFDNERLDMLFLAEKIVFKAEFNSPDAGQKVKLYDQYKLSLKLVGDLEYRIDTSK